MRRTCVQNHHCISGRRQRKHPSLEPPEGSPRRVGWAVHGFLVFVTVNATVVFGPPGVRVACGVLFAALAVQAIRRV